MTVKEGTNQSPKAQTLVERLEACEMAIDKLFSLNDDANDIHSDIVKQIHYLKASIGI